MRERNYFNAKIQDLIQRESGGAGMAFSSFLTPEESAEAAAICRNAGVSFLLYGGYEESERKILAVSSLDMQQLKECFPIRLIEVACAHPDELSNRDVLGALMAAGIRRDVLGDIIVRDGLILIFALDSITDFLLQNITSVGRQQVRLSEASMQLKIPEPHFEFFRITAASLRADAVIGGLCRVSREQASRLIDEKRVLLNHCLLEKKTKEVTAGDCLILRGFGKWKIDACDCRTKKGRVVLECRKYS